MDLRHLRYFIAVAEQLNFSRAAEKLHIAEPPLSRQIRQLEEELSVQLFLRDRRRVALTDAGTILLKEAGILLAQASHLLDVLRQAKRGEAGSVKVGVGTGLGEPLRRVLAEHSKRFPAVEISCTGIFSSLQCEAAIERRIDVGFLRPPAMDASKLISEPIFQERLVVLISKKHQLATRKRLKLSELAAEPLALQDSRVSSGLREKVLDLYRRAGITPKLGQSPSGPFDEAQAMFVASGKGICIAVDGVLHYPGRGKAVTTVPLDEPENTIDVHMIWRRGEKSAVILAFLDSVRNVFKRSSSRATH
jgi:LysR family transcriptional regulator, benzoate and cis,cis-muconate-responsive activator of ben and cat genes